MDKLDKESKKRYWMSIFSVVLLMMTVIIATSMQDQDTTEEKEMFSPDKEMFANKNYQHVNEIENIFKVINSNEDGVINIEYYELKNKNYILQSRIHYKNLNSENSDSSSTYIEYFKDDKIIKRIIPAKKNNPRIEITYKDNKVEKMVSFDANNNPKEIDSPNRENTLNKRGLNPKSFGLTSSKLDKKEPEGAPEGKSEEESEEAPAVAPAAAINPLITLAESLSIDLGTGTTVRRTENNVESEMVKINAIANKIKDPADRIRFLEAAASGYNDGSEGFTQNNAVAATIYQTLAIINPDYAGYYFAMAGDQWVSARNYENALKAYTSAIKNSQDNQEVSELASKAKEALRNTDLNSEEKKIQENIIDNLEYMNTKPWGDKVFSWLETTMSGYPNIASLFYDKNDVWIEMSPSLNNWLSGPDGIAAELCKEETLQDITSDSGFAFSQSTQGASAHIEGEKITVTNTTNTSTTTYYIYKISFKVNPGTASVGCGLRFKAYFDEDSTKPIIIQNNSNSAYQFDIKRGDAAVDYTGPNMIVRSSTNNYEKVCILFDEITPRGTSNCMIGIGEGDYLCNQITAGAEQVISKNDFDLSGWWKSFTSASGSSSSSSPSATSGNQPPPTINPRI
jgi:hypothetical protein